MTDPRIGYFGDDITFPELTLLGREVNPNGAARKYIGGNRFVILDDPLPPDFDLDAEIAKLVAPKAPAAKKAAEASKSES